ncbi:MAG: N-acetyltransferase [Acidimicrobiales bacterium]|jgi:hypothetical protein
MIEWVSERLSEVHDLSQFDSGQESLDLWLRDHAAQSDRMNTARTFGFHKGDHQVIGYYSLTMGRVQREELPSTVVRGGPRIAPVVLLARLAVVERAQGQGMGAEFLFDALARGCAANALAVARAIVVNAIKNERRFSMSTSDSSAWYQWRSLPFDWPSR